MRFRSAIALTLTCALVACAAAIRGTGTEAGATVELTRVEIAGGDADLGGLSAIEVTGGGAGFLALTDRGLLYEGEFTRENGTLTGARVTGPGTPFWTWGRAVSHVEKVDTEGLALLPGGGVAVSLEAFGGIWIFPEGGGAEAPRERQPDPRDFPILGLNGMYEALAVDPQGRLVTLPETPAGGGPRHQVWRLEDGAWQQAGTLYRDHGFLPVGADFGPDGMLYVLERSFRLGFRNRIRRLDLDHPDRPAELVAELPPSRTTNLEGLSVWQDGEGRLRLTMISDDNFLPVLDGVVAEISLDPAPRSR